MVSGSLDALNGRGWKTENYISHNPLQEEAELNSDDRFSHLGRFSFAGVFAFAWKLLTLVLQHPLEVVSWGFFEASWWGFCKHKISCSNHFLH